MSQIHFTFQYSPSCNNTTIQTTLPFLLAFNWPTYASDKNLCYSFFSVLKFGNKKCPAGLGSGLFGSCVTNGAPVMRQQRRTVESRMRGSVVMVTGPAMFPPSFRSFLCPLLSDADKRSLIHTVTPTRKLKTQQTSTVRLGNEQLLRIRTALASHHRSWRRF